MTITQSDIITILETGSYPSSQKTLKYFQQKQKFPRYPFVEVRKVQSDSNTTDVQKTSVDQTFEIRFYMRYTRPEATEEADRLETENEMLRVLEAADIEPTGVIYFESKQWNTSIIDDGIYGSKSVLRFTVKDVDSTTGSGLIGSDDKIELNSQIAATGSVTLDSGSSGSVDGIAVNGVEIMDAVVSFDTDLSTTATNVASNINAFTSSPNYTAVAVDSVITITSVTTGTTPNDFTIVSSTTTITTTDVSLSGGLDTTQIQILALTTKKGFSIDGHSSDDRIIAYDPNILISFGEFTVTYENTTIISAIIDTLSQSGAENDGKLIRAGVETNLSFLVGQPVTTGVYGEVEKATVVLYANGIWS